MRTTHSWVSTLPPDVRVDAKAFYGAYMSNEPFTCGTLQTFATHGCSVTLIYIHLNAKEDIMSNKMIFKKNKSLTTRFVTLFHSN